MQLPAIRVPVSAAALVLALSACTGTAPGSDEPAGEGDSTTLRYLVELPEDAADLELLDEHLGEFEAANPGITVELESMQQENMRTVLQTQLRSGEGPDVFAWGSGPGYAGALAEAGLLYDLTAAYEERDWPVYEFAKERVTVDGKIVGVPGDMETIGLFYNADLFAELGIEAPTTLAELETAAQTIKASGVVPLAVSDQEGWQGGHLLSMALSSRIGSEGMDALLAGEQPWTSPDVVASLDLWKKYNDQGYLSPFPTSLSYDGASALFYSGEAAMVPTGSWLVPTIEDNVDFEVGYIPFPGEDGPGVFTSGLGSGPYVSANTDKVEEALTFLDFLVSPEHGRWTAENLGTIPPYPIDTADVEASPLFAQVLEDTSTLSEGSAGLGQNIDVLTTDEFNEAMWDGVQALLSDQKSAEDVAADLEAAAQG